jgi:D-aspartate ligase
VTDRTPVVVLGGDSNALSIARSLGPLGVAVYGLGVAPFVLRSRFVRAVAVERHADPETAWTRTLLGPATDHLRGALVIAGSDVGITVLARNREALRERYVLDDSDVDVQLGMLDKLTTYEWAREAGVRTPLFWRVDGVEDLERHRDEYVFPLIVKPVHSHEYQARFPGLSKFRVVGDLVELRREHAELTGAGLAVLLVEQIPGGDDQLCSYYTYLDPAGKPTFHFTKRVIRRHPPGMGIGCYHITDWNPAVRDAALPLFEHTGLRGLANAEFKRDPRDGQLKLIECNARFTAANGLVAAAGLDLARHVYHRALGEPHELPTEYRTGMRLLYPSHDVRAYRDLRRAGQITTGRWVRSLVHRQVFPFLRLNDPLPAVARGAMRLTTGLRRALGR